MEGRSVGLGRSAIRCDWSNIDFHTFSYQNGFGRNARAVESQCQFQFAFAVKEQAPGAVECFSYFRQVSVGFIVQAWLKECLGTQDVDRVQDRPVKIRQKDERTILLLVLL